MTTEVDIEEIEPDLTTIRESVQQHIMQIIELNDKMTFCFRWIMFFMLLTIGLLTYTILF